MSNTVGSKNPRLKAIIIGCGAIGVDTGFGTIDELLSSNCYFDIASVCVPTSEYANILEKLLGATLKGVFCEKPISGNLAT